MLFKNRSDMRLKRTTILLFCFLFTMAPTFLANASPGTDYGYRIVYKKCVLEVQPGSNLQITGTTSKSTVKIQALKKPSAGDPKEGVAYILSQSIPSVSIMGDLKSFFSEAPVESFFAVGTVRSLTMKNSHAESVKAQNIGSVKMTALMNDAGMTPTYASTLIETEGTASMKISLSGVVLLSLQAPRSWTSSSLYFQPGAARVKVKVASKAWKNEFKQKLVSLSGIGGVIPGSDDYWPINAAGLRSISAKGASIAPSAIASGQTISTLKAKSASLANVDHPGHIGFGFSNTLDQVLLVRAPNIGSIYGTSGVFVVIYAGFDTGGNPTYEGGVKSIGTKKGVGMLSGTMYVSISAKPTKFKPDQGEFLVFAQEPQPGG